jgi:hypothetical protein
MYRNWASIENQVRLTRKSGIVYESQVERCVGKLCVIIVYDLKAALLGAGN